MIRRSAAVAVAVTLHQLVAGKTAGWTPDQEMVLDALRRSKVSLHKASDGELGDYLRQMSPEQLHGVASNVKGIFHEMLVMQAENADGDAIMAQIFEATNHQGSDIEFLLDGDVVREVQLKAVQDSGAIAEHFSRYPDIDVLATSEVYRALGGAFAGRVSDSGVSNEAISDLSRDTLEQLVGEDVGDIFQDGVMTSLLVTGALQARAVLAGRTLDVSQVRSTLELVGIGAATAVTVQALLHLI
jgi:hypothetical protein